MENFLHKRPIVKLVFESMTEGVLVFSKDGRVIGCNAGAERVLARTREELLGRTPDEFKLDLVDARDRPLDPTTSPALTALASGKPVDAEIGLRRADGTKLWLRESARAIVDSGGTVEGVVSTFVDITSMRRALSSLADIMAGANVGVWEYDLETGNVERDETWFGILGLTPAEVSPTFDGLRALVHPEDLPVFDGIPSAWTSQVSYRVELRLRAAGERWKWVQIRGRSQSDGRGKVNRIAGVLVDIAARKELEASLSASLAENVRLVDELRAALSKIHQLEGLLPICMYCKSIRDKSDWIRLETYISERSTAEFSHGICPACYAKEFPEDSD